MSRYKNHKLFVCTYFVWIFNNGRPMVAVVVDDPIASDVKDKTRVTTDRRNVNLADHFVLHYSVLELAGLDHQQTPDGLIVA